MHKFVALMHRYCHDYTNRQDFAACDTIWYRSTHCTWGHTT